MTTEWVNSINAGVSVTLTTPCARANPTLTISPARSPALQAGAPETYTVTVINNDASNCTASAFNLGAASPSGWSAAFGGSSLTLSPGASGSTSLIVTSPWSAAAGLYSIVVNAQNSDASGYVGSSSATYQVAPRVAVSTNSSTYKQGGSVYVTVVVTSGGSPMSGASVNCTVTGPNSITMSATATTGANGSATVTFKLKRNVPMGTYQVLVFAAVNGVSGTGTANFTVQ